MLATHGDGIFVRPVVVTEHMQSGPLYEEFILTADYLKTN